jgi:hypothetical protein
MLPGTTGTTGTATSLTPAPRRMVQHRPWSRLAGGRPCRAGGWSTRRHHAVHRFISWR